MTNVDRAADNVHRNIRERFDQPTVASSYRSKKNHRQNAKNRRELKRIEEALLGVPQGSKVLDLPTGTGRLVPMLYAKGFDVVAADYSTHMLSQAKSYWSEFEGDQQAGEDRAVEFRQEDVMNTSFSDKSIDVTICNRLF